MKMLSTVSFAIATLCIFPDCCFAQHGKAIQTLVKVLTGVGAAESIRRSGQSFEEYKHEDAILTKLRNQGVDANDSSIFSVYFKTTGGYWADFWSYPDVFFIVDIEGQGSKLVPQIRYNYKGEPIIDVIVSKSVRPGSRIVVRVLDDDSSSDLIWNNILQTRVNLSVTPKVQATQFVSVQANASGQIGFLNSRTNLDTPDFIASAEFIVPESNDGLWVADAKLIDGSRKDVGTLKFASLWAGPQQIKAQRNKVATSFGSFLFWGVIGVCLLGWFTWSVVSSGNSPQPESKST